VKRHLVLVAVLILTATTMRVSAQEIHSEHFWYGKPEGTASSNDLIIRDLYALSANETTRFETGSPIG